MNRYKIKFSTEMLIQFIALLLQSFNNFVILCYKLNLIYLRKRLKRQDISCWLHGLNEVFIQICRIYKNLKTIIISRHT